MDNEPAPPTVPERDIDDPAYRAYLDRRFAMLDIHAVEAASYTSKLSTWMIGQLFVANAGAFTIAKEVASREALLTFVAGVIAAMVCSLTAWWQSHLVFHEITRLGSPNAYFGREHIPTNDPVATKRETRFMAAAVGSGIVSLFCFAAGSIMTLF